MDGKLTEQMRNIEDIGYPGASVDPGPARSAALLKSSGMIVGARISGAVFGLLTQVLLAKFLGAEDIGIFFFAIGLAAILSIVGTMGYPMLVPRVAAESVSTSDPSKLAGFMSLARKDAAVFCAVMALGLVLTAWLLPTLTTSLRTSLIFAALTLPAFMLLRLNGSLANALKRFELGFLPDLFLRPLALLGLVVVLGFAWQMLSIEAILVGHVLIAIAIALGQTVRLANRAHLPGVTASGAARLTGGEKADLRRRALPMVLAALFIGVFADMDIVFARLFLDDVQTGILGVFLKISLFVGFGIQAIHQIILRDAADALHAKDDHRVHQILARANILTLAGSVGSAIAVIFFGREILAVFGTEFQAGFECLVILMFAQVVRAAAGPAVQILTLTGHEKACLPVFAVCMVALLLSNAILIYWFGLLGAAGAVLLVSALWSIRLAVMANKKLGLRSNIVF